MNLWTFLNVFIFLTPISMIGFGKYFVTLAKGGINNNIGYRTKRSMRNSETWEYAHIYCGKLYRVLGWASLIISIVAMAFLYGKSEKLVGKAAIGIIIFQIALLISSVIITEISLKKKFGN